MSIVAVIQSQLLQTLFKALDLSALKDGQEVTARVLSTTSDGKATLDIGGKQITANFQNTAAIASALVPGQRITLKYDTSGPEPKLTLLNRQPQQQPIAGAQDRSNFGTGNGEENLSGKLSAALQTSLTEEIKAPLELFKFVEPIIVKRAEALLAAPVPRVVLLQNLIQAVNNQGSISTVLADIEALLTQPTPEAAAQAAEHGVIPLQQRPLPATLFDAIGALIGQQLNGDAPVTASDIKQALKQSGLFYEAGVARGDVPSPVSDLKAALLSLKDITRKMQEAWVAGQIEGSEGPPQGKEAGRHHIRDAMHEPPPPPRRDSMPESQRAHSSRLQADLSTPSAAHILETHADQALDRIKLLQFASLPPFPDNPVLADVNTLKNQVWSFELPIRLPRETTVAGFRIEKEHKSSNNYEGKIWRVNFAIDTEELGAVHGRIGLQGSNIAITLFAERAATSDLFRKAAPDLREALGENSFEVKDFAIYTGKPSEPRAKPGYFVDSAA